MNTFVNTRPKQQYRLRQVCAKFDFPLCSTMMAAPTGRPTASGVARRRRERRLRSMLKHRMVLATVTRTAPNGDRPQPPGPGGGARGQARRATATEAPSFPVGPLQLVRRRAQREAACHPGRAARAARADPAAHRGAACRLCSLGAGSRYSCGARPGDRSALDHSSGPHPTARRTSCPAAGGAVGCSANGGVGHRGTSSGRIWPDVARMRRATGGPPAQGGIQILGAVLVPQIQEQIVEVDAPLVDVSVIVLHKYPAVRSSDSVHQQSWPFQVCHRGRYGRRHRSCVMRE